MSRKIFLNRFREKKSRINEIYFNEIIIRLKYKQRQYQGIA